MGKMLTMMGKSKMWAAATFLVLLHTVILFAGFIAPYDPVSQNRDLPFVPPTRPHFINARGDFHLRPFIYQWPPGREACTSMKNPVTGNIRSISL